MNAKASIAALITVAGVIALTSVARHRTPPRPQVAAIQPQMPAADVAIPPPIPETAAETPAPPPPTAVIPPPIVPPMTPVPATPKGMTPAPKPPTPNSNPLAADAPPPHPAVPLGRAALSFVGMDDEAELVWALTINDPTVPAEARKDLIEDLNEDGFVDPKHLTPADVPLIVNRMALIEQMAPDSIDENNAAAFMEAYKDLQNMLAKAAS